MSQNRSSLTAKFINYEILNNDFHHRRLNFIRVKDTSGNIIKDVLCIDESESLKIIGHLTYGDIVNFTCDDDFKNIEFCYPHGPIRGK